MAHAVLSVPYFLKILRMYFRSFPGKNDRLYPIFIGPKPLLTLIKTLKWCYSIRAGLYLGIEYEGKLPYGRTIFGFYGINKHVEVGVG